MLVLMFVAWSSEKPTSPDAIVSDFISEMTAALRETKEAMKLIRIPTQRDEAY